MVERGIKNKPYRFRWLGNSNEPSSALYPPFSKSVLPYSFAKSLLVLGFVLHILTTSQPVHALDLTYGGRLASPSGEPLSGPLDLNFRFYRDASGGSALFHTTVPNVPLVDGMFQASLNLSAEDLKRLFEDGDKPVFVEVETQGKVYPRQKFSYVPLALRVPVDGSNIVYDSQGRLTLGSGVTSGTLPGAAGSGGVEKTGDQSYSTFPLSDAGKTLVGAPTAAEQRTVLGLGALAQLSSITPADIATSNCPDGTVMQKGPSGWGCQTLSSANLSPLVSQTEFDYLDGVTSPIQDQLNHRLPSAGGTLSGPLTLSQGSEFRLATTNAGISAGFKAPANLPTSTIYTLPSGLPADGQMLTSSSSGILAWSNVPVTAVNGQIGNVSLNADSIDETASRKYYSHTLARQALSSTGLLSYNPSTGVMSLSDTLLTKSGGTMTGSLDFAGTLKVTNLADPIADGDAAKKAYVDGKLGGQPLVVGTPSPGQVIKWDGSKFALATDAVGVAGGGISSLNTLTAGSQSLAVETPGVTTGTRPSWTADSGTSTHTLTIPMAGASGVTAGLIAKTDYDVFSSKQEGITPSSTIALGSLSTNLQNALDLKPYGTSAGQTGEMRFRELNASGMNYVGLKAPDNLVTNTMWTLPSQDGTSGYVLSTNGSGSLSWISPTTGSVTSIATGTGLSGGPISGVGTISLANVGTAGTYAKVTTNAQGQVISGTTLVNTDIPNLPASKITSGTLAVEQGGTGAATAQPFSVLAGPSIGPTAGAPSFRTLVPADIPSLDASKITSGTLSSSLINWAAAPVTTVAGRTGAVTLLSSDISGLGSLATVNAVSGGSGGTITDGTITNADISTGAAIADSKLATIATAGKVANSATTATSASTANAIVARDASGNFTAGTITATLNGNATNVTGTVGMANGGTGAATASQARSNLGAAASGANSDISSLSGLTTALSLAQGGTGATTALQARSNIGAAASGANTDITSLSGLSSLTTTGNVGIGTTSPSGKLDVSPGARTTVFAASDPSSWADINIINKTDTLNAAAGIRFTVDASGHSTHTIGIAAVKADPVNNVTDLVFITDPFQAVGTEQMRITSAGNVGIGTTAPNNLLEISGGAMSFRNTSLGWTAAGFDYDATADALRIRTNVGGSQLNTTPVSIHRPSGNVGIGTTSPISTLQVSGTITANQLFVKSGNNGSVSCNTYCTGAQWGGGKIGSCQYGYLYSDGSVVACNVATGVPTHCLCDSGSSQLGIGVAIPALPLDVMGGSGPPATSGTTATGIVRVNSTNGVVLDMGAYSASPFGAWMQVTNRQDLSNTYPLVLQPNSGNVGIGTTTPGALLDINGQVKISGGSPGVGKVLTSDASGVATWESIPTVPILGSAFNLKVTNNSASPNTSIDISSASLGAKYQVILEDSSNPPNVYRANQTTTLTINAATTGANGLDSGTLTANTWYYYYLIYNGTSVAGLISNSSTTPTMPSGYTYRALLGAVRTNASSQFIKFLQMGKSVSIPLTNIFSQACVTTYTAASLASAVPPIASRVIGTAGSSSGSDSAFVSLAANASGLGVQHIVIAFTGASYEGYIAGSPFSMLMATAQTIYWKARANTSSCRLDVSGWEYP